MSKTILFFGNERLATGVSTQLPLLRHLAGAGYDIAAIIITPQAQGPLPSRSPRPLEVSQFASDNKIPLLQLSDLKKSVEQLTKYQAAVGILAAYGKIVPQTIINMFPKGIINLHPSLLPRHRGPTPIESTILSGEEETGVSLMQLVASMDAGPVYDQVRIQLTGNEEKQSLADELGNTGAERLIKILPSILDGSLTAVDQPETNVSYDQKISPEQSEMDFSKPAYALEREIRAFSGWPKSKTTLNGQRIIVTKSHVINAGSDTAEGNLWHNKTQFGFLTSDGILVIDRLIPAGSKEMSAADYLIGHRI